MRGRADMPQSRVPSLTSRLCGGVALWEDEIEYLVMAW
jgi:hypothetical protein